MRMHVFMNVCSLLCVASLTVFTVHLVIGQPY
jgi:hypothetical protein